MLSDFPLPIDELVPNPSSSESPNETSEWFIGGFDDAHEAVRAMLDAGFVWDASVQAVVPPPADPQLVPWIEAGTDLAKRAFPKVAPARPPTEVRTVSTRGGFAKAAAAAGQAMVFFVCPPAPKPSRKSSGPKPSGGFIRSPTPR